MPELPTLDAVSAAQLVPSIGLAIALSATAGLRAWLPLLITALLSRAGVVTLGESFEFLSSTPALIIFSLATLLEIGSDKIPALDHALDVISTFVRPAAGALLAASVMFQVDDPLWASVFGLIVGAPTALLPHAAKSTVRAASTATTGGLANPVISVLEDVGTLVAIALAIILPILAGLAVLTVGIVTLVMYRRRKRRSAAAM